MLSKNHSLDDFIYFNAPAWKTNPDKREFIAKNA
jgi:hypothetical protein